MTSDNTLDHPPLAFNSTFPTLGNVSLGTPNEDFGGNGQGAGGETGQPGQNDKSLNNVLILSDGGAQTPNPSGGTFIITFTSFAVTLEELGFLDIPVSTYTVKLFSDTARTMQIGATLLVPSNGANGISSLSIGTGSVRAIEVDFSAGGAITNINYKVGDGSCAINTIPICLNIDMAVGKNNIDACEQPITGWTQVVSDQQVVFSGVDGDYGLTFTVDGGTVFDFSGKALLVRVKQTCDRVETCSNSHAVFGDVDDFNGSLTSLFCSRHTDTDGAYSGGWESDFSDIVPGMELDVALGASCICVAGETLVRTTNGHNKFIKNLKAGDVVTNNKGQEVKVKNLIVNPVGKKIQMVHFEKGSIFNDGIKLIPERDTYVTKGHYIKAADGEVRKARTFVNERNVHFKKRYMDFVYSLMLEDRSTFFVGNGMEIRTHHNKTKMVCEPFLKFR